MQKIMFNDRYGLTQAVIDGRKTMARRISSESDITESLIMHRSILDYSRYKVGDIVAVAQSYNDIYEELKRTHGSFSSITRDFFHNYIQGGRMPVSNKMLVKSEFMPHQIRITDIKVERLQDISDEDALMEGVRVSDFSLPQNQYFIDGIKRKGNTLRYKDEQGWHTFKWQTYENAIDCFAALIDKVSGKGTWERNPWVFAYTFELVK